MNYQVSVVVVSYNPVLKKLLATLQRIIEQKEISVEIILCDDCSKKNDYFAEIREFFNNVNFHNYTMIRNDVNQGIVSNFYGGILKSTGEYVFMGSPGDYLYDEYTLKNLYDFAKKKKAEVCFGDAIYYHFDTKLDIVKNVPCGAYNVSVYEDHKSMELQKLGTLFGNYPAGAVVFRERQYALKYIGMIKGVCRYLEDLSLRISSFDGIRTYHYDGYILWYEYGTGLSTNSSGNNGMLSQDEKMLFRYMLDRYQNDKMLDFYRVDRYVDGIKRRILFLTKYLDLYIEKKKIQMHGTKLVYTRDFDVKKFPCYLVR